MFCGDGNKKLFSFHFCRSMCTFFSSFFSPTRLFIFTTFFNGKKVKKKTKGKLNIRKIIIITYMRVAPGNWWYKRSTQKNVINDTGR